MFNIVSHWAWTGAILKRWNHSKSWVIFAGIRPKNYHHLKEWHLPKASCICITLPIKVILHHIYSMGMYILDHYLCYVWNITFLINNTFWKIQDTQFRLSQHKNIVICCKKVIARDLFGCKFSCKDKGYHDNTWQNTTNFHWWSLHAIWRRHQIIRSM